MSRGDISTDVVGSQPTIATGRRHQSTTRDHHHRIHTRLVPLVINKETVLPGGLVIPSGF